MNTTEPTTEYRQPRYVRRPVFPKERPLDTPGAYFDKNDHSASREFNQTSNKLAWEEDDKTGETWELVIVPRHEWCNIPPKWKDPLKTPVPYVFSTFTRRSYCSSRRQCLPELQYLHYRSTKYNDKPDIVYNFLIGGDGLVYEGRGWTNVVNLPRRYNALQDQCIAIAMIGTFLYEPPSDVMKKAQNQLIKYGMDNNFIRKKFTQFTT